MRLNRFNPSNIKVRGGGGGGRMGGGGGKIGCGAIVIALAAAYFFGADPGQMLGAIEQMQAGAPTQSQPQTGQSTEELCTANSYATESCNALDSLNQTWAPLFQQANIQFDTPTLNFYRGGMQSGCGAASSAMGPFYCPADQGIYIDTSFYDTMRSQMGAPGDFARYYVMAHEYGHHIQYLTGVANQVRSAQQRDPGNANQYQVRMELQADCYAGVWAGLNRNLIDPGDMEEGMTAANAIGDDTLMKQAGRRVDTESFTHGSSAQRMQALRLGLESGDEAQCDRYISG